MTNRLYVVLVTLVVAISGCQYLATSYGVEFSDATRTPCDQDGCPHPTWTPLPPDWPTPTLNGDQITLTTVAQTPSPTLDFDSYATHYFVDSGTPYNPDRETVIVTATLNPDQIQLTQLAEGTPTATLDDDGRATHSSIEQTSEAQ